MGRKKKVRELTDEEKEQEDAALEYLASIFVEVAIEKLKEEKRNRKD